MTQMTKTTLYFALVVFVLSLAGTAAMAQGAGQDDGGWQCYYGGNGMGPAGPGGYGWQGRVNQIDDPALAAEITRLHQEIRQKQWDLRLAQSQGEDTTALAAEIDRLRQQLKAANEEAGLCVGTGPHAFGMNGQPGMGNRFGRGPGMGYGRGPGMGRGRGPGMGYGRGPGMGYGRGYGPGPGYGQGYGRGYGPGPGYGQGYGRGYGRGAGMGYGQGYGPGPGYGRGAGFGRGYGPGPGYGMGYGRGAGTSPTGLSVATLNNLIRQSQHQLAAARNAGLDTTAIEAEIRRLTAQRNLALQSQGGGF
jgi:hypothetical protein